MFTILRLHNLVICDGLPSPHPQSATLTAPSERGPWVVSKLYKIAVAEHGNRATVTAARARDGEFAAADHEVLMQQRVVDAMLQQRDAIHVLAAFEAGRIRLAKREMAGGILVKKRVVEQQAAL